ncbi:hypothetical protein [Jeotgalibaca porci]|uniref:hypothetical protein n=1 Tax=Jeotgalibaca porci TaxID=1868793 RepID=UPI0035A17817
MTQIKTVRDTFESIEETYTRLSKAIEDGLTVEDFNPSLNEIEVDIYHEIVKFNEVHPNAIKELYSK